MLYVMVVGPAASTCVARGVRIATVETSTIAASATKTILVEFFISFLLCGLHKVFPSFNFPLAAPEVMTGILPQILISHLCTLRIAIFSSGV
jgi:hypothetical protein